MGVRGFVEFYEGSGDFLKERQKKVALILADRVYGFYFLIEKRIILFEKIITFFTIKIFKNLDNKNLNFSCDFSPIFEDPPITSLENTACSLQIKGEVLYLLFIFGFLKIRKNASFFVIFQCFFSGFRNIFSMIFQ